PGPAEAPGFWKRLEVVAAGALLLGLTVVTFYQPLLKQFWGGFDDLMNLDPVKASFWSIYSDIGGSRPLTFPLVALVRGLFPGRIDVFLWLGAGLWWANGLLLFALLRRLLPRARAVPWLAAALLVLHHADPVRFLVLFATIYYQTGVFFFQ